jgi:sterol-4alpha-carboxylate 3-dehydrogenase (decarboxylating)
MSRLGDPTSVIQRALVTGSNGFVAANLVKRLRDLGVFVRGLDITDKRLESDVNEFVKGDLTKPEDVENAVNGCDTVFHVAAVIHGPQGFLHRVNVGGTQAVIDACCKSGVARLVFISSSSVVYQAKDIIDGKEDTCTFATGDLDPYGYTKALAEQLIAKAAGRENGLDQGLLTVSVRPHSIYGPGDIHSWPEIIKTAREGRLKFRLTANVWKSSFTYVDNVSHSCILAAEALAANAAKVNGNAYFVNDGDVALFWSRLWDVAELGMPQKDLGKWPLPIPFWLLYFISWLFFQFGIRLGNFNPFYLSLVTTHHYYNIDRARKDLGYEPVMPPEKSWKLTKDYFREWVKKNPYQPKPASFRRTLVFVFGALTVAVLAYFARARWVGVLDIFS